MIVLLIFGGIALAFAFAGLNGAPYVPVRARDTAALLKHLDLKPGQTLIDLGSGDGRMLRATAARGARAIGYEINPVMVAVSRLLCLRYRRLITIHQANLWQTSLPPADVVYVFIMPKFMPRLDQYLDNQITQPTLVVSYIFKIPGREIIGRTHNCYLYQFGIDK
jgi:SAM-dependent methyltransferase